MPFYRIKTNRFAEWKEGDFAAMDDEAARVPLELGEIELYVEEPVEKPVKKKVAKKKSKSTRQ
jgi:hypothetical protein